MFNRKRATDLFVEGGVIVVSILLAFALEAGWAERGERMEETEILQNLQVEFLAAGVQLDRYMVFHEVTLGSLDTILAALREAQAAGRRQAEVATIHLSRILINPTFDPRMGTLDGLVHSGKGAVLESDELQSSLASWPGLLAEAKEEEARIDRLIMDQMGPALRSRIDISAAHLLNVEIETQACGHLIVGRSCDDFEEEAELPARWSGTTALPVNFETMGLFAARLDLLSHGVVQFREVRAEIDRIRGIVEDGLG